MPLAGERKSPEKVMIDSPVIGATFVVYLVVVLVIGVIAWRRTASLSDYILGGRKLGSWVTALSAQASDMSAWLLLGLPGYAYLAGLESVWLLVGLMLGTYANWLFVAGRLRTATEKYGDALTLPDYFERRFADDSGLLRMISASFILVFFTFYTSSGLVAGGKLFESVFGMPYVWAVAAGGATVVIYTFIGGFLAVSWTDFLQGSLMFLALLAVVVMGWLAVDGWAGTASAIAALNPAMLDMFTDAAGEPLTWIAIASLLGWGLGYVGQPHILARFMAAQSARETIPVARRIAMSWVTVTLICAGGVHWDCLSARAPARRRLGKSFHIHGICVVSSGAGRYLSGGHTGGRYEHSGFTVAGGFIRRIRGLLQGHAAQGCSAARTALGREAGRNRDRAACICACLGS